MRFGLFGSAQARRNIPVAEARRGFTEYVETNVEAEALGYHSTFLVEHHFTGMGQVSSSLTVQSWVAAKTTTLRIGTAVVVLPWHNPVLLAEQAATVDLMSGGRLEFGVGRGYRHNEFEGFRIDVGEASARFEESLELILKSWTSESRFSHHGRFWQLDNILVEPQPAQRPHPPVWIAAGQPDSIRKVAALGCNLLLDQFALPEAVEEKIALYRSEVEACGRTFDPMQVAVARNIYVATSAADAAAALERQAEQHARMIALSQRPDGANRSHITAYADAPGSTLASSIFGDPEKITSQLHDLERIGVRYVLLGGGHSREGIRRFAADVMPAFNRT